MKKIVLSLSTVLLTVGMQAQKAEMDASITAFQAKNYAQGLDLAKQAESLLATNHTDRKSVV